MRKGVSAQRKQHGVLFTREESCCSICYDSETPSRSEGGWDPSATSSQTATGAPRARGENDSADGRSRIHARGSSGLQRALAERRVRITPAAPGALIRFHPRGKDVALTCTGRYRASLGEGAHRCLCCRCGSSVLLSSSVLGKTESTPVGCGGRLGRTSIHTNLSVTVISLGECSPWVRGKFVCLLPLIEWDAARDEGRKEDVFGWRNGSTAGRWE